MLRWTFLALLATTGAAHAGNFEFLAAPEVDLNRVYRVDKGTGEVGACQFGLKDGEPVGVTLCYGAGEGAGAQPPSDYALVSSRHEKEGGVFRSISASARCRSATCATISWSAPLRRNELNAWIY